MALTPYQAIEQLAWGGLSAADVMYVASYLQTGQIPQGATPKAMEHIQQLGNGGLDAGGVDNVLSYLRTGVMPETVHAPAPAAELDPDSLQFFRSGRRKVDEAYDLGTAQNNYQRQITNSQYQRNLGDLTRQYDKLRTAIPFKYAARGLSNSGLYKEGLTNYGNDRVRAFGNLRGAFDDQNAGFDLADQQLAKVRASAQSDLNEQEQTRMATVAASLRGAR
jgi:hypothetical protein